MCCVRGGGSRKTTHGAGAVLMFAHSVLKRAGALMPPRDPGSIGLASEILPASKRESIQNTHKHTFIITVSCCVLPSQNNKIYLLLLYILYSNQIHSCCWETFVPRILVCVHIIYGSSRFTNLNFEGKYPHASSMQG